MEVLLTWVKNMETKKDIRRRVLDKRNQISKKEWETNSHIIFEKVVTHSFFLEADKVLCFLNYQSEVDTRNIIQKAWSLKKELYVPKIVDNTMYFYRLESFNELKEGYKGIEEPIGTELFHGKDGLVIVPGVVFDRNRNRIGYGKGFYDRFLQEHSNLKTIAIAFESQVETVIPNEQFDIKPEFLITEENIYHE